jgi:hypothetical protein
MVHNDIKQQTILTVGSSHAGSRNICGFKQFVQFVECNSYFDAA